MTKLIDLTQEIKHNDQYGQHYLHPRPFLLPFSTHEETRKDFDDKYSYRTEFVCMVSHQATHVDAPSHTNPDPNALTIDRIPLENFYGEAVCLDLSHIPPKGRIKASDLKKASQKGRLRIKKGDIVLLYTGHWNRTYNTPSYVTDHPGLEETACRWLIEKRVRLFGIDATSPETMADQMNKYIPCHEVLRDEGLMHIENLCRLDEVAGKRFTFVGFPIKLKGSSGGPMRAVAMMSES